MWLSQHYNHRKHSSVSIGLHQSPLEADGISAGPRAGGHNSNAPVSHASQHVGRAGGHNGNAPMSHASQHVGRASPQHIGRASPARAASLRRRSMDDEAEISSGTDTDEDGALIEKARQAAEQKRAAPRKRGPTSKHSHACGDGSPHCM